MATVTSPTPPTAAEAPAGAEGRSAVRDSLLVVVGGQLERVLGTVTSFVQKWWLDPAQIGVYTGLRLYLDNTNRSSLGVSLGAVQEIPILRAGGHEREAQRLANVAHTTNTATCLLFAAGLLIWAAVRAPLVAGSPLAGEWTWGLVVIAGLALIKRYQDWLISVLRAHQEFALLTRMQVLDALVSCVAITAGVWLAGFWGLLAAVGVLLGFNIVYLHASHPLRFRWEWDWPIIAHLMRVGLPILANTAVFGAVLTLDRVLILWLVPEGERAAGLYSIALMGTSWSYDLAGRIVLVMYTYFQTTLGRTRDPAEVARQAVRVTEAQTSILAAGSAVAYLVGPVFLGATIPRYAAGLPALRPLLFGMLLLGLAWPARQMLITIDRPFRLCLATLAGLLVTLAAGAVGAHRGGIVGVAWGMTIGYAAVFVFTSAAAFIPVLGGREWLGHQVRLARPLAWFTAATLATAHLPLDWLGLGLGRSATHSWVPTTPRSWLEFAVRCLILAAWLLPALWVWGRRHQWGGLWPRRAA